MAKFQLRPDEYVLMKSVAVRHGGAMASYTDDLVLTNRNVILVSKSVFGNTKGIEYFPLGSIKNIDDRPQAFASELELEIYFFDRHDSFGFRSNKEARTWATNVCSLLTGGAENVELAPGMLLPGTAYAAEEMRERLETLKQAFRLKSRKPKDEMSVTLCGSCGASISGLVGRVVRCQFCATDQKL